MQRRVALVFYIVSHFGFSREFPYIMEINRSFRNTEITLNIYYGIKPEFGSNPDPDLT